MLRAFQINRNEIYSGLDAYDAVAAAMRDHKLDLGNLDRPENSLRSVVDCDYFRELPLTYILDYREIGRFKKNIDIEYTLAFIDDAEKIWDFSVKDYWKSTRAGKSIV